MSPKVKICGITNQKDALFAAKVGADALGFVFYEKSPRYIEPTKAKEIASKLPPFITKVALFVEKTPKEIDEMMEFIGFDLAQLHFEVDKGFADKLKSSYIKVIRARSKEDILSLPKNEYLLVDAFVESYGGEGKRIDKEWFSGIDCSKLILAGGLNSSNISQMKEFGFYGYDVSSGVEKSKGIKDHKKIEDFIKAVKVDK